MTVDADETPMKHLVVDANESPMRQAPMPGGCSSRRPIPSGGGLRSGLLIRQRRSQTAATTLPFRQRRSQTAATMLLIGIERSLGALTSQKAFPDIPGPYSSFFVAPWIRTIDARSRCAHTEAVMTTPTVRTTVAFDPASAARLERLAKRWGVSKAETLRRSLTAAEAGDGPVQVPGFDGMTPLEVFDWLQANPQHPPGWGDDFRRELRAQRDLDARIEDERELARQTVARNHSTVAGA